VESETDELNRLRTQVAQTPVCGLPSPTPELSPTATPTSVPAVAAGTPISPPIEGVKPSGKFLRVNATVTNNAGESRTYPFRSWVLIDDQVRTFEIADDATSQATGSGWYRGVDPSLPQDFAIIFDVALDSGKSFVLESRDDLILRVSLQIQVLG